MTCDCLNLLVSQRPFRWLLLFYTIYSAKHFPPLVCKVARTTFSPTMSSSYSNILVFNLRSELLPKIAKAIDRARGLITPACSGSPPGLMCLEYCMGGIYRHPNHLPIPLHFAPFNMLPIQVSSKRGTRMRSAKLTSLILDTYFHNLTYSVITQSSLS